MTARWLFHACRKAGITLAADGGDITFDAPEGVAVPAEDLRRCKTEVVAVLAGDYWAAAVALLQRLAGRIPDTDFDRLDAEYMARLREHLAAGMNEGHAHRAAYIAMARDVEGQGPSPRQINASERIEAEPINGPSDGAGRASACGAGKADDSAPAGAAGGDGGGEQAMGNLFALAQDEAGRKSRQ